MIAIGAFAGFVISATPSPLEPLTERQTILQAASAARRVSQARLFALDRDLQARKLTFAEYAMKIESEALAPIREAGRKIDTTWRSERDPSWLRPTKEDLEFRAITLESIAAIYLAKATLLEAQSARSESDQEEIQGALDAFWRKQLPLLSERLAKLPSLWTESPRLAQAKADFIAGLERDVEALEESAVELEIRRTEKWLGLVRTTVEIAEARGPASTETPLAPSEISKELRVHLSRLAWVSTTVERPQSRLVAIQQHLLKVEAALPQ